MKYFILFIFALCPWLLIFGTFGAFCAVVLVSLVLLYLCTTKSGKIVKIGLARMLIKLENLFNE
jgi:multisubunit Na+/H+ antiporter MnhE subunit